MRKTILFLAALYISACGFAQTQDTAAADKPKGKAVIQVFANFHSGFGANNNDRGFELDRTYLGYEYDFGKGLSVRGVMDIGKPSSTADYHRIAYIKNALLTWKTGHLTLSGGLISTTQFNFQEKFWGYRYIMKSFQDEYKFGSSADLGLSVAYRFAPWISADAAIVNGEGYKKIQHNDGLNYALGVTLTPLEGFHIRLYGGWNESSEHGQTDIWNLSAFAGYRSERFRIGAEYAYMQNASYKAGADQSGYSLFSSVKAAKWANVYARFDDLYSKKGWNIDQDEYAAIVGAEFRLGKYVKLAPNFRIAIPKAAGDDIAYAAYVNCFFGL